MALSARPIRYIGSLLPTSSRATTGRRPLTPHTTTQVRLFKQLLDKQTGALSALPPVFLHQLQAALAQSLFWVYLLTLVLATVGLVMMLLLPGGRADQYSYKPAGEASAENDAEAPEAEPIALFD